jgi:hypothetical protein
LAKVNEVVNKRKNNSTSSLFIVLLVVLSFLSSVPAVQAAEVTLAWDPNPEPAVQGYRVYYGTASGVYTGVVDAGSRTDCVVSGLDPGVTYFFACTAYSAAGDESNFSSEIVYSSNPESSTASGNNVAVKCFIATAAYGSGLAPEVQALRKFRDRHLLTNRPGKAFVDWYYSVSPSIAAFIAEHEPIKTAVRWGLAPVVFAVKYPTMAFVVILVIPATIVVRRWRSGRVTGDR